MPKTTTLAQYTPCATQAPAAEAPEPACKGTPYSLSAKDTTECTPGYKKITDVKTCYTGAKYLNIQNSDVNGDGQLTPIEQHVFQREIAANSPLGHHKPYGCFVDVSLRIVKGVQKKITTIWLNHNLAQSSKHDNSAPLCQLECAAGALTRLDESIEKEAENKELSHGVVEKGLPTFAVNALGFAGLIACVAFFARKHIRTTRRAVVAVAQDAEDCEVPETHSQLLGTEDAYE
jgi:hypothetical protein